MEEGSLGPTNNDLEMISLCIGVVHFLGSILRIFQPSSGRECISVPPSYFFLLPMLADSSMYPIHMQGSPTYQSGLHQSSTLKAPFRPHRLGIGDQKCLPNRPLSCRLFRLLSLLSNHGKEAKINDPIVSLIATAQRSWWVDDNSRQTEKELRAFPSIDPLRTSSIRRSQILTNEEC
jgi:hypothetical protein